MAPSWQWWPQRRSYMISSAEKLNLTHAYFNSIVMIDINEHQARIRNCSHTCLQLQPVLQIKGDFSHLCIIIRRREREGERREWEREGGGGKWEVQEKEGRGKGGERHREGVEEIGFITSPKLHANLFISKHIWKHIWEYILHCMHNISNLNKQYKHLYLLDDCLSLDQK